MVYLNPSQFKPCITLENNFQIILKDYQNFLFDFNNINDWKNIYDIQKAGAVEGNKKNCEKGAVCVGGYIASQILIVINYDDNQSNYISTTIEMDY